MVAVDGTAIKGITSQPPTFTKQEHQKKKEFFQSALKIPKISKITIFES
jgi:hypothetical protein